MPHVGTIDFVEALGLQTYGKEKEDSNVILRRPKFQFQPVIDLYKVEVMYLYAKLELDSGANYDRGDEDLFDEELDLVLEYYGPIIWPRTGHRSHLREPDRRSRYPRDLYYPQDKDLLKENIRQMVSHKKSRSSTNFKKLKMRLEKKSKVFSRAARASQPKASKPCTNGRLKRVNRNALPEPNGDADTDSSVDSDDSVLARSPHKSAQQLQLKQRAATKAAAHKTPTKKRQINYEETQVQLFSKSSEDAYQRITLAGCTSAESFFAKVSDAIEADLDWVNFFLPEDLSDIATIRIERGSRASAGQYQTLVEILKGAPRFPKMPPYRRLEAEYGLDLY